MQGTGRLGGIQKLRCLALHCALELLARSLLHFSLHCCGQLTPCGIAACQGSLPDNWRYSAPPLFPHPHSPAFSLAPGGSSITHCLQGAVSAHAPAAASWRLVPKTGSSFCSWGFAHPLRHVQLLLSRWLMLCSMFWFYLQFPAELPSALGNEGSANQPGLSPLQPKLLPSVFSCSPEETNPSTKLALEAQMYLGDPAGQGMAKDLRVYFPPNFSNSFWHHDLQISINSRCTCCG